MAIRWPRYPLVGIALTGMAALTSLIPAVLPADDDRYMAISLAIALYVVGVTAWLAFAPVPEPAASTLGELAGADQTHILPRADKSPAL